VLSLTVKVHLTKNPIIPKFIDLFWARQSRMTGFVKFSHFRPTLFLAYVLASVGFAGEITPTDWPQWRGPTRDSQVVDAQWPNSLDENHLELS